MPRHDRHVAVVIDEMQALRRDFGPEDLKREIQSIENTVGAGHSLLETRIIGDLPGASILRGGEGAAVGALRLAEMLAAR